MMSYLSDIGESTKLVSEYKAKLQISEAENAKLEGTVSIYMYSEKDNY